MATRIWYDLCRKMVKSEAEGLGILASPEAMKLFTLTSEACINGARARGVVLTDVLHMEPLLVVNPKRDGIYAEYTHYISVLVTALQHVEEPS